MMCLWKLSCQGAGRARGRVGSGGFFLLGRKGQRGGKEQASQDTGEAQGERGGVCTALPAPARPFQPLPGLLSLAPGNASPIAQVPQGLWGGSRLGADSSRQLIPWKENCALRPGFKSRSALTSRVPWSKNSHSETRSFQLQSKRGTIIYLMPQSSPPKNS